MIPEELKKAFGLNDKKDLNMANNIWKMLDDMASSDPQQYKQFVNKNINQGFTDMKQKKQQKEKQFKIKPSTGFSLSMSGKLHERPLQTEINTKILITKQPWQKIKKQLSQNITICLNITYSNRIKPSISKSTKKQITQYSMKNYKDIQFFYYSLQGPTHHIQDKHKVYYCMILNQTLYSQIIKDGNGKKAIIALCVSYLQDRLLNDKNPLLAIYNPNQYRRLAFYSIDKYSIQICDKNYNSPNGTYEPEEFLLQKQVDVKRYQQQQKKQKKQKQQKQMKFQEPPQIKFKRQQQKQVDKNLMNLKVSPEADNKPKKVLIEVLKQEKNDLEDDDGIPYQMKQTELGYHFQFLLKGISSLSEIDLEMKPECLRLKVNGKRQWSMLLKRKVNERQVKAKFKKKLNLLIVQAIFE